MYHYLTELGIRNTSQIEKYSLRQEAFSDVLTVYFHKQKGELFARNMTFKYPRQKKTILVDSGTHTYKDVTEINRTLTLVLDELNEITVPYNKPEHEFIESVIYDLKHFEKSIVNKISTIGHNIHRLHH